MQRLNTIRFRLTIWNSIVVIALALLSLFLARQAMVYTFEQETRELLKEEITELEFAISEFHPDMEQIRTEFERKILSHSRNGWFAQLFSGNGETAWKSESFPPSFDSDFSKPHLPFTFRQKNNSIACWHTFEIETGERYTIVLGEPIDFISRDLRNLTRILIWVGLSVLIIAPVGGYLLASRAMMPVQEIVKTTRSLQPSILEERLPIRGSGDELDQISSEINSFLDQNRIYLNSQREFIANAAHELRSPLTAIQTSVEVCLSKPRSTDEYCEQMETVIEQCQYMRHLVNQLLELAEADARLKVTNAEFDFSILVTKSLSVFEGVAEEKGLWFDSRIPANITCCGDQNKLIQVINNLIDNAIKFSDSEGAIQVELAKNDNNIHFRISNPWGESSSENPDRIFDRFYQAATSRNKDIYSGNGLGLSICKSIVELHNGEISATSSDGQFTIIFQIPTNS